MQLLYGARKGNWNLLKRWIAKAMAHELSVLPVPGADVLRVYGLHLEKMSIKIAAGPREANVLLVAGQISEKMAAKAAIAYAQMPRPRILIFAGTEEAFPLPHPDLSISSFTEDVVEQMKTLLTQHAWHQEAKPFKTKQLEEAEQKTKEKQGHMMHHAHGGEHDHQQHEGHESEEQHKGDHRGNENAQDHEASHQQHEHHQSHKHEEHEEQDEHENNQKNSGGDEQEGHEHDQHSGGHDMGFMSMVAMTKDMPRSMDGLAMEMSDTHFGPFFPGLPGGLSVAMQLDGDTVMKAEIDKELIGRNITDAFPMEANAFPEYLSKINPLSPVSFRLLAETALINALQIRTEKHKAFYDILLLEQERIFNHLNWLATFGYTVGNIWLQRKASLLWHQHQNQAGPEQETLKFIRRVKKLPYLEKKLMKAGALPENLLHHARGPVARAAGLNHDVRTQDAHYQMLSFSPVVVPHNNAWGRLLVRLSEIEQSLYLIQAAKSKVNGLPKKEQITFTGSGEGQAAIETPRGKAELKVHLMEGKIQHIHVETPSFYHAAFIKEVAEGQEVADALVGIASLDISPWEIEN